jgi:hypothetical protein
MTAANDSEISAPCPSESAAAWGSFTGKKSGCQHHSSGAKRMTLIQAMLAKVLSINPSTASAHKLAR